MDLWGGHRHLRRWFYRDRSGLSTGSARKRRTRAETSLARLTEIEACEVRLQTTDLGRAGVIDRLSRVGR